MVKNERHARILKIIEDKVIGTQEELLLELIRYGIDVTQATVSRDIKELRLTKALSISGGYKYTSIDRAEAAIHERLIRVFSESVISIDYANNLIVIKTIAAGAQAAAAGIDALRWQEVIGCVAGDDTILVIIRDSNLVLSIIERFKKMLK